MKARLQSTVSHLGVYLSYLFLSTGLQHTTNQISFIATGPKCWVDIYSKKSQKGEKYTIQPLQDVDLSTIPLHDSPGHSSFNDNVKSGFIRSSDAADENPESNNMPKGVVPVAVGFYLTPAGIIFSILFQYIQINASSLSSSPYPRLAPLLGNSGMVHV